MHVSIVIPTYNRARLLSETIPALANQITSGDVTYEVIFVSNGSKDDTEKIIGEYVRRFPEKFRYFYIAPTGGPSAPRNVGIREARGDVVVIMDDDVVPESDLVQNYSQFHRQYPDQHHAAIGEVYVPERLLSEPISRFRVFPYDEVRNLDKLSYLHFWTCCVSLKRQFMLESGMFDESFMCYEDTVCGYRLALNGMHLHFWPAARGAHLHQMTTEGIPARGLYLGRWLLPFLEQVPDPAAKERFGVLSADLPKSVLLRKIAGRIVFRITDNPLTIAILEALGARGSQRSRVTDFYYSLIFRRNILAGYREAKRRARAGQRLNLTQVDSTLADRGDR
jgi:glycosyltransferase involved in cell wall biosynthesis